MVLNRSDEWVVSIFIHMFFKCENRNPIHHAISHNPIFTKEYKKEIGGKSYVQHRERSMLSTGTPDRLS